MEKHPIYFLKNLFFTGPIQTCSLIFVKLDDYRSHIICSRSVHGACCADVVEELLYHWAQVFWLWVQILDVLIDFLDALVIGHAVPNTVACHNNIVVILVAVLLGDIWHRCYGLLLWR